MFYYLGQEPNDIFAWYQKLIGALPSWLWKPLGGCYRCWVGQCAFWFYLITYFKEYNFINHAFFISAAILLSIIYNYITTTNERIENH